MFTEGWSRGAADDNLASVSRKSGGLMQLASNGTLAVRDRPMPQISRIDDDRIHTDAWLVRVQCRNRIHHRHFSDRTHGGKRLTLAAATA